MILLSGYTFQRHRACTGGTERWRCATHHLRGGIYNAKKKPGCNAFIHTYQDYIIKVVNEHNHKTRKNWVPVELLNVYE